ncbi:MAG: PHP domain-containing protein [Oscillospiraceae bacterium]|nr:PHP domain-containing protein [Oscillospiraceae bacterium]
MEISDRLNYTDNAPVKRVELHAHTKMSAMDGIVSAKDLVKRASEWGHEAIAITDSYVVQAFPEAYMTSREINIKIIYGVVVKIQEDGNACAATLLAKDLLGLKNLYKLISLLHTKYFCEKTKTPYLPMDVIATHRGGLLIGSGCSGSSVYEAIHRNESENTILDDAKFYDYLELDATEDESINTYIVKIGELLDKPVVAVGNVHYLNPKDKAAHRMLHISQGHEHFDDSAKWHFSTTEDMLTEVEYLGDAKAFEVVITNTNLIAKMIERMPPIPEGFFPPSLDGADDEIVAVCNTRVREVYGETLPDNIRERLDYELGSILNNGYSSIYMAAQRLVRKSNEVGYVVGSRGSVGASLVAYLLGITDVDPLKHDMLFETYAGIDGDRVPKISLNFSNSIIAEINQSVEDVFGKDKVFRAGTIDILRERLAKGVVAGFFSDNGITPTSFEAESLVSAILGVKKTTGQHPGGLIILPADKDIYDFTPTQYPANDKNRSFLTTHFEYHTLENNLFKIDLLGHGSPTMIKKLEDLTCVDAKTIPIDDEKTLDLLKSTDALCIPDFGDEFARDIIITANPKTFDDYVKIFGLTHGMGAWCDNAANLIVNGIATISEVIAVCDDVMLFLLSKGIRRDTAFVIMENVRTGKGLTVEHMDILLESGVPEWYIESCNRIQYLLPKAHAAAYTMMSFHIAWFKTHHPEAFDKAYVDPEK